MSGFTVHHHMEPKPTSKSGAFMEDTKVSQPFGADQVAEAVETGDSCFQALGGETADSAAPGSIKPAYFRSLAFAFRSI